MHRFKSDRRLQKTVFELLPFLLGKMKRAEPDRGLVSLSIKESFAHPTKDRNNEQIHSKSMSVS